MREICRGMLLLCVGSMSIQTHATDARGANEVAAHAPPGYSSPQEAFVARRNARAKRDWRTCFASSTPVVQEAEAQDLVGCWILTEAGMEGVYFDNTEDGRRVGMVKLRAVMKKHGLEHKEFWAQYLKEYHATHGVDLAKLTAEAIKRGRERMDKCLEKHPLEREAVENHLKKYPEDIDLFFLPPEPGEEPDSPLPELDDELFGKTIKTMTARVTNQAVFYEEASEIIRNKDEQDPEPTYDFSDLQGVAVSGDSARGWIEWTIVRFVAGVKKASQPTRLLRSFRRLDGRWYNDSLTEDFTSFDPKEVRRQVNEPPTGGEPPGR